MGKFNTVLGWGDDNEAKVTVTYIYHRAYADTLEEPGEPENVEIQSISGDVPDSFYGDEDLIAECLADYHDDQIAAAEYRSEQRKEGW